MKLGVKSGEMGKGRGQGEANGDTLDENTLYACMNFKNYFLNIQNFKILHMKV